MKKAKLGDFFLWEGKLVQCLWINEGHRSIGFKSTEKTCCPNCNIPIDYESFDVIEDSPLFQQTAEPIKTITDF